MAEVPWNRMTAAELRRAADKGAMVLLPVASTGQHGPHLATGVDTFLGGEVCRRTAELVAKQKPVVVAPTVWMGLAEHHVAYGGTFSVSIATYHALLRDLCDAILRAGFKKIMIVNSHGGNSAALTALTTDLSRELRRQSRRRLSTLSRISMGLSHRSSRIRRVSDTPAKQKPR